MTEIRIPVAHAESGALIDAEGVALGRAQCPQVARRIAACLNACTGIPQGLLEAIPCGPVALLPMYAQLEAERDELRQTVARQQAQIDALMLEFCPGGMSAAQVSEWAKHQRRVEDEVDESELHHLRYTGVF